VQSITDVEEGMTVKARVTKVGLQQLNVDVGNGIRGRVHVTECLPLADGYDVMAVAKCC
jgi:ribosomal protein S1